MELSTLRHQIDEIDREVLRLLEERLGLAMLTSRFKDAVRDARREAEVMATPSSLGLELVGGRLAGAVLGSAVERSRDLQERGMPLVAFQGERGAYGEIAARRLRGDAAYLPCATFGDVFRGVEAGHHDLGVVPVENTIEGSVTEVNELLTRTSLSVVGEAEVPIRHRLLAPPGADHREVRVAYSHPQALAQCRGFLARARIEARPYYNSAGAARMIARERPPGCAAVASGLSAELWGLQVLAEGIEDSPANATRFLALSRAPLADPGDKCSLVFCTEHAPGRLHAVLRLFADAGINLTRIASIPSRAEPGQTCFFVDLQGSDEDEGVQRVLRDVAGETLWSRVLGCYPAA